MPARSADADPPGEGVMRIRVFIVAGAVVVLVAILAVFGRSLWHPLYLRVVGRETVASQVARIDAARKAEIESLFTEWPPRSLTIIAFKRERICELWEPGRRVAAFPILAASGGPGPKLRAGDRQVPEGVYDLESLNPNSAFHLALRVGYPNASDRAQAVRDGRDDPGGDIMIHGGSSSIGCIAIGDPGIEVVFKAAAAATATRILIAPQRLAPRDPHPAWVADIYRGLYAAISATAKSSRE